MERYLLMSLLVLAPGPSFAAWELYGGLGGGFSFIEGNEVPVVVNDLPFIVEGVDGTDFSVRAYAGIRVGPYLGLEVGYIDFGTVNDDVVVRLGPPDPPLVGGRTAARLDASATDAFLVGYYPLNEDLTLLGRIGMANWDVDADMVEDVDERIDFSDDGTDIAYGIGADYRAGRNLRLRLELQYYDIEITKDVWNVMASLQYGIQFRR